MDSLFLRTTRRRWLGGAAAAAALGTAGAALGACGPSPASGAATAAPTPVPAAETIPFQLYFVGPPINKTSTGLIQQFIDDNFNARHKGIRAVFQPPYNMSAVVTSILAGADAPVVVSSCCSDWPIILPFLEPLDPYLKRDNVDMSIWKPGQLDRFQQAGALYGLAEDAASDVFVYRQDILDDLGLEYPDPEWDYREAQAFWSRCSGPMKNGRWRYGTTCPWGRGPGLPEGLPTALAGFGGAYLDQTGTRCLLDRPESIQAGEYWMQMVWSKVATEGGGYPNQGVFDGTVVFSTGAEPTVLLAVENLGSKVKWDFHPWPRFPARPVGKLHDNFYGMLASAKNKEIAWQLLKWAAIDTDWSRFYMRVALAPPALVSLFDEWFALLRQVAPVLGPKKLEYWAQPTRDGNGVYDNQFFRYAPAQINNIVGNMWPQIWDHKIEVAEAFRSLATQITAMEATAQANAAKAVDTGKRFPTDGPDIAAVPAGI